MDTLTAEGGGKAVDRNSGQAVGGNSQEAGNHNSREPAHWLLRRR